MIYYHMGKLEYIRFSTTMIYIALVRPYIQNATSNIMKKKISITSYKVIYITSLFYFNTALLNARNLSLYLNPTRQILWGIYPLYSISCSSITCASDSHVSLLTFPFLVIEQVYKSQSTKRLMIWKSYEWESYEWDYLLYSVQFLQTIWKSK